MRSSSQSLLQASRVNAETLGLTGATISYTGSGVTVDELERRLARDVERGTTGVGPHLRDISIAAGSRDLRAFGSQGEQRVAVLALVLAEAPVSPRSAESPLSCSSTTS